MGKMLFLYAVVTHIISRITTTKHFSHYFHPQVSQQCIWASDYWANMLNIQALNAPGVVFHVGDRIMYS
jgi:hypothetical protein